MTVAPRRHVELEGVWNFRDLGGYEAPDGRTIRWRTVFRADGLDRLTEADLAVVAGLGLRTVIDLRTEDEVAKGRLVDSEGGPGWHHLPVLDALPPAERYEQWVGPEYVAESYLAMVDGARESIARFLALVSEPTAYPLVFHCFAGKDRTGVLTALVLGLLGVDDEVIAADYALSQVAMDHLLAWLRDQYGTDVPDLEASAAAIAAAEPETMLAFLGRFRAAHGSFEDYAAGLGQAGAGSALRAILLQG
jgi:protein tyrosine/serine phosphatase